MTTYAETTHSDSIRESDPKTVTLPLRPHLSGSYELQQDYTGEVTMVDDLARVASPASVSSHGQATVPPSSPGALEKHQDDHISASRPNEVDNDSLAPLYRAALTGLAPWIRQLLDCGADIHARYTTEKYTALHIAAQQGHEEAVRVLLKYKADVDSICVSSATPLHWAARNGHKAVVQLLLIHNPKVNAKGGPATSSPLYESARRGDVAIMKLLLDGGANTQATNYAGHTPLHTAASRGHDEAVELLLEYKADVKAKSDRNVTPLYLAAQNGHAAAAKLLLRRGPDVNEKTVPGATPLYAAASNGHFVIVHLLLADGASTAARTNALGYTALHVAALNGRGLAVNALLLHNADVEARAKGSSLTPLDLAAQHGHAVIVQTLLENGAKWKRQTLRDAKSKGHASVAQVLESRSEARRTEIWSKSRP
jgi:ankyrin